MSALVYAATPRTAVKVVAETPEAVTLAGHLVVFDDPKRPVKDLAGDYFTSDTYFGARSGDGADCLFHHGIPLKSEIAHLADAVLPPLKVERDDIGLFASVVLDMANEYHAAIAGLARKGALGWSSGSAPHMVKRGADGHIKRWPIIEGSLTPTPCEPRTSAVPIKAVPLDRLDLEGSGLKFDGSFEQQLDRIRSAYYQQSGERGWVEATFADYVVVQMAGRYYRAGYTDDGTAVTFDPMPQWQEVERSVTYDPVTKALAHELKSLNLTVSLNRALSALI